MAKKAKAIELRNRITGLQYIRGQSLQDNAGNWRTHPKHQAEAMEGVLREVGIAGALLVYQSERHGGVTVIDGHLRKALHVDQDWPCLMTDLTDEEADYVLLTHDWLGFRAEADRQAVDALLRNVTSGEAAVQSELGIMAQLMGMIPETDPDKIWQGMPDFENENAFGRRIIVHFESEKDVQVFANLVDQVISEDTKYIYFPKQERANLKSMRVVDES